MIHRGEILQKAIAKSGKTISEISRNVYYKNRRGVSRQTIYDWFHQPNLSVDIMLEVGKVINHDFSEDLAESLGHYFNEPHMKYGVSGDLERCKTKLIETQTKLIEAYERIAYLEAKLQEQSDEDLEY